MRRYGWQMSVKCMSGTCQMHVRHIIVMEDTCQTRRAMCHIGLWLTYNMVMTDRCQTCVLLAHIYDCILSAVHMYTMKERYVLTSRM